MIDTLQLNITSQRKEERNTPSSLSLRLLPWYYKFDLIFSSSSFLGDTIFFRSLIDTLWGHLANSAIYQVPIHTEKKKKRNGEMNRQYKWVCTHSPVCAASPCVSISKDRLYSPLSFALLLDIFFTLISFSLPFPNSIRLGGETKIWTDAAYFEFFFSFFFNLISSFLIINKRPNKWLS